MEDSHWDELLAATLDSARVAQASQAFQEFMNSSPDACLVCLEKAANPARAESLRDRSLVLMQKPFEAIQKLPREVSDPICQRALEMIVPMTGSATPYQMGLLAGIFAMVFKRSREYPAFLFEILSQKVPPAFAFEVCFELVQDFPEEMIVSHTEMILGLGCQFMSQNFRKAVKLILAVLDLEHGPLDLRNVVQFTLEKLHSRSVTEPEIEPLAYLVADLVSEKLVDVVEVQNVVALIVQQFPMNVTAFAGFEDIIDVIPGELLQEMLRTTVAFAVQKMKSDQAIGSDDLDFCGSVLEQKGDPGVVSGFIKDLVAAGDAEKCIALYLMGLMIRYCPAAGDDPAPISDLLHASLRSGEFFVRKAALEVLIGMGMSTLSANLTSIIADLINETVEMLSRTERDDEQTVLALQALDNLCQKCDSEIEGLIQRVWALSGMVSPENGAAGFVRLMASVVKLMEEVDDDFLNDVVGFLENMFKTNDPEIQAESLKLVAEVVSKEESMAELLLPACTDLFGVLLKYENKEVVSATIESLGSLSESLQEKSIPLIQPVLPVILEYVKVDENGDIGSEADDALSAAACYACHTANLELMSHVCGICLSFLKETERPYLQDAAARAIIFLSKSQKLAEVPVVVDIFQQLVQMLLGPYSLEYVSRIFDAAGAVFKRARRVNEALFNQKAIEVIQRWLAETINGQNIFQHPGLVAILDDIMLFVGRVFKAGITGVDQICAGLLQAMANCTNDVKFCILGALTDAVEYCQVSPEIISNVCQLLLESIKTVNDLDFRQNVAYFMSMLMRKYPQQVELGNMMRPAIEQWWTTGLTKKSGYEELLVNCASFFLSYGNANPSALSEAMLTAALTKFPPNADIGESASMLTMICSLLQNHGSLFSEKLQATLALSLAKLFTEPESKLTSRKIPDATLATARQVFKTLMNNPQINEFVRSNFQKKRTKIRALEAVLSA